MRIAETAEQSILTLKRWIGPRSWILQILARLPLPAMLEDVGEKKAMVEGSVEVLELPYNLG